MDCRPPGSPVHGIFQASILDRAAISCSRGSSQSRDRTQVSRIAGRCCTIWATREVQEKNNQDEVSEITYAKQVKQLWSGEESLSSDKGWTRAVHPWNQDNEARWPHYSRLWFVPRYTQGAPQVALRLRYVPAMQRPGFNPWVGKIP